MEDQSKFFNVVIDKTNQKLNSFQAQVIVLESQLQMAIEERDAYKRVVESATGQTLSASDLEALRVEFLNMQTQLKASLEENIVLKNQVANSVSSTDNSTRFLRDQNETLLQEIRRLKAEMAAMSGK
jgi:predicted  nucleic acid-binding Zn-ribbon protein